jgi:hypothetical protein
VITIQGSGNVRTITMRKHLGIDSKKLYILLCFDYQNGIANEKKDLMFANEPNLFSISTTN